MPRCRSTPNRVPGAVDSLVTCSVSGFTVRTALGVTARSSNRALQRSRSNRPTLTVQGAAAGSAAAGGAGAADLAAPLARGRRGNQSGQIDDAPRVPGSPQASVVRADLLDGHAVLREVQGRPVDAQVGHAEEIVAGVAAAQRKPGHLERAVADGDARRGFLLLKAHVRAQPDRAAEDVERDLVAQVGGESSGLDTGQGDGDVRRQRRQAQRAVFGQRAARLGAQARPAPALKRPGGSTGRAPRRRCPERRCETPGSRSRRQSAGPPFPA